MEDQTSTIGAGIFFIFYLAVIFLVVAGLWKLFVKAGRPGWAAVVPIYNTIVMQEIVGREGWKIIFLFIPFVNFYFIITLFISFAKAYGKRGIGNYLAVIFLGFIFIPLWGFSDGVRYEGPVEGPAVGLKSSPIY